MLGLMWRWKEEATQRQARLPKNYLKQLIYCKKMRPIKPNPV